MIFLKTIIKIIVLELWECENEKQGKVMPSKLRDFSSIFLYTLDNEVNLPNLEVSIAFLSGGKIVHTYNCMIFIVQKFRFSCIFS